MDTPRVTLVKGVIGMAASSGSFVISMLAQVEAWLRVVSLLIGITVGILSALSIWRKMRRGNHHLPRGRK